MSWPEVTLLCVIGVCATVAAVVAGFDPLAVFTGILGWGASRTITPARGGEGG